MTPFEQVYETYFQDVFLFIRRLSGNEQIAEEITSETFFYALRAIKTFRGECDLRVWLCQIAKNRYYTYQKKNARNASIDEEGWQALCDPQPCVEEQITRRETAKEIQALLHKLPEPYKEVFMWRMFAELSFKQIGQIFHKSDNWACVTYHRAKAMLQSGWEDRNREK